MNTILRGRLNWVVRRRKNLLIAGSVSDATGCTLDLWFFHIYHKRTQLGAYPTLLFCFMGGTIMLWRCVITLLQVDFIPVGNMLFNP
jgi:hypothetical protein